MAFACGILIAARIFLHVVFLTDALCSAKAIPKGSCCICDENRNGGFEKGGFSACTAMCEEAEQCTDGAWWEFDTFPPWGSGDTGCEYVKVDIDKTTSCALCRATYMANHCPLDKTQRANSQGGPDICITSDVYEDPAVGSRTFTHGANELCGQQGVTCTWKFTKEEFITYLDEMPECPCPPGEKWVWVENHLGKHWVCSTTSAPSARPTTPVTNLFPKIQPIPHYCFSSSFVCGHCISYSRIMY